MRWLTFLALVAATFFAFREPVAAQHGQCNGMHMHKGGGPHMGHPGMGMQPPNHMLTLMHPNMPQMHMPQMNIPQFQMLHPGNNPQGGLNMPNFNIGMQMPFHNNPQGPGVIAIPVPVAVPVPVNVPGRNQQPLAQFPRVQQPLGNNKVSAPDMLNQAHTQLAKLIQSLKKQRVNNPIVATLQQDLRQMQQAAQNSGATMAERHALALQALQQAISDGVAFLDDTAQPERTRNLVADAVSQLQFLAPLAQQALQPASGSQVAGNR